MNLSTWQELTELKSNLIQLVVMLTEDENIERELVAADLLMNVQMLQQIEDKCIKELRGSEFPKIVRLADKVNVERKPLVK